TKCAEGWLLGYLLVCCSGQCFAVKQSEDLMIEQGQSVLLNCSQSGTTHSYMYWFKQEKTETQLQLVAFLSQYSSNAIEKPFKDRFETPGMKDYKLPLILKKAETFDTGVYFCATQDHTVGQQHRKPDTKCIAGKCKHLGQCRYRDIYMV
uniref:Ig-like domain-containing protein n=1 Tax=Salvator merianae TaxID=96440 RepID=A0A8D0BGC3_SALMN